MKTIELVSHCWRYSRVLAYQLASLVLHPPARCRVVATVFCCDEDEPTCRVIAQASRHVGERLAIHCRAMRRQELLNRSIGRNRAARATEADLVWFTDCDYCFGPGCLGTLAGLELPPDGVLFYVRHVRATHTHELGNQYADRMGDGFRLLELDPADFFRQRIRKAIGGVQIVRGETARAGGYCPDSPPDQRAVEGERFRRNWSDITYRRQLGTSGTPIELPNLFRIRQRFGQVDSRARVDSGTSGAGA